MTETSSEMTDPTDHDAHRRGWTPTETIEQLRAHTETRDLVAAYETVVRFSQTVEQAGGRSYLVGGAVRDEVLQQPPHDFDLEVHGLRAEQLEPLIAPLGSPESSGKSFGTYKFRSGQAEIQVALPRTETVTGPRHTDYDVELHPEFSIEQAARRRDFTIGAMYKDVLTGELHDPFGGIHDLEQRALRMVDARTFGEDALRVLRGARFVAKFDLQVESQTQTEMANMVDRLGHLPKERLRGEWSRLLLETDHPSQGIELLRQINALERLHPELTKLWSTPQDARHHPEGDVGTHTMMALDAAAQLEPVRALPERERLEVLLATLAHDLGKPLVTTTEDGVIRSINHEAAGVKPTEEFLNQIGIPAAAQRRIILLVSEHMRPTSLYANRDQITDRALRKLARDVGPSLLPSLIALSEADHLGRGPLTAADGQRIPPNTEHFRAWWQEQLARLHLDQAPEPLLWGRDLVERGWKPGPQIGEVLRLTEELAVQGLRREDILAIIDQAEQPDAVVTALRQRLTAGDSTTATTNATAGTRPTMAGENTAA